MPELPEVETVRRGIAPAMEGRRFIHVEAKRPDLRFPLPEGFAARLAGRRVLALARRGKFLLARLDDGALLIMHLGMSGRFAVEPAPHEPAPPAPAPDAPAPPAPAPDAPTPDAPTPDAAPDRVPQRPGAFHFDAAANAHARHEHVVFRMEGGAVVRYSDPRRFGFMDIEETGCEAQSRFLRDLGPEPLGPEFDAPFLARALAGRRVPLKAALLDQSVVAGLGNIYLCEALFRAGLSPRRRAASLVARGAVPTPRLERLVAAIRAVLEEAIEAGGSSLRDHARTDGRLGYFQHAFRVYDREGAPCPTPGCGAEIRRIVQSGRSTFYCSRCQR